MQESKIESKRIISIVNRMLSGPPEVKKCLPNVLSMEGTSNLTILTKDYFLLAFLPQSEIERVRKLMGKNFDPFPGLIKPEGVFGPVAIKIPESSRNSLFTSNTVVNMYSFSLGKDSTCASKSYPVNQHQRTWIARIHCGPGLFSSIWR